MNQSISGRLYLKMFEHIDGCNGIKVVPRKAGFGIHEKRTMLFTSLNKRYMNIPAIRVDSDKKPYNGLILFIFLLILQSLSANSNYIYILLQVTCLCFVPAYYSK